MKLNPFPNSAKDWPEDFSHENGNYLCLCTTCGSQFIGYKRRVTCRECSDPSPAAPEPQPERTSDEPCNPDASAQTRASAHVAPAIAPVGDAATEEVQPSSASGHPEDFCHYCGRRNPIWFAPNELWNSVMRHGGKEPIICPTCFAIRAAPEKVWILQLEPEAPSSPLPASQDTPLTETLVNQQFVDRIIARAQNSMMSLGEPEGSYDLSKYDRPNLDSVAILLVSAHHAKYDLVSLFAAGFEEMADKSRSLERQLNEANAKLAAKDAIIEQRTNEANLATKTAEGLLRERDIANERHASAVNRADTALSRLSRMREALEGLVSRLLVIHQDPSYQAVWTSWQIHGGRYQGPFYVDELAAARKALSDDSVAP